MHLNGFKTLALVITVSLLEVIVLHHSTTALPIIKAAIKDGDSAADDMLQQEQQQQQVMPDKGAVEVMAAKPAADAPPHEVHEESLKFKKEEQIGIPVDKKNDVNLDVDTAKKLGKLPVEKLKPADHIDGVKMEQDGHINKQYHKEMFLGDVHEEFKSEAFDEAEEKLKEIVVQADASKDGELSKDEMEMWILGNMKKHLAEAEAENEHIFKHLDPDGDGFVKWKEYYVHFLLSRGIAVERAIEYIKDYDENNDDSIELNLEDKDFLMSYKFKWTDADKEPTDDQLSKDEFMVFRHPEHSKSSLQMMVENVLRSVDTNNDGMISMAEFSALPAGEVEGKEFEEMDRKWQSERRKEFEDIMDINHDGQVTGEELKRYLDPTNPIQAKIETESLLTMIDDNKDHKLSMAEIMKHKEIFITSKLANFGANVHDEF